MKITALIENTCSVGDLTPEHGLSFFIETEGKKIVFDTGSSGIFAENAKKLGIRLEDADFAVVSHGHYDHGGGVKSFFEINASAPVYIRRSAFDEHWSQRPDKLVYCGLDQSLFESERFIFTDSVCRIDDDISLFSEVPPYEPIFESSKASVELIDGSPVADKFLHEQNLVIRENGRYLLIAGCAHSGIYNIIRRFRELYGRDPDTVIGGFHLMIPALKKYIPDDEIDTLAGKLSEMDGTEFYTCHCTGEHAFEQLRLTLGDRIKYFSTGMTIEI